MKTNAVLIIDPNESWRENLSEQLASRSVFHPISTAEDGQSALERIQQEKPDVLILELLLPQYDGLYLINQIRTQNGLDFELDISIFAELLEGNIILQRIFCTGDQGKHGISLRFA